MALINFRSLYEKIFSSFDVSADTKLVEELEKDGVDKMIIIKRSWIFGIFISWMFVFIIGLMIGNSYLIYLNFENKFTASVLIGLLSFNIIYWVISVIIYFSKFTKIYGDRAKMTDPATLKEELRLGDIAFTKFFNQTIFNYFILIGITSYIVYDLIFGQGFANVGGYGIINIILLFLQVFLSSRFKKRMCDLEMDFCLVMPGKVIFYNQSGILRNVQAINSEKIKTITSNFSHFIGSIFNYGEITVMTEGDDAKTGEMHLFYIAHPTQTVHEINTLLGMSEKDNAANTL